MAETKKRRAPQTAKPFYLVYEVDGEEIRELAFSRKTDDILKALADNQGAKVIKLEPPKAPPRSAPAAK